MYGDYADLCCERDLMNDIYSNDDPEDVFDSWGTPVISSAKTSKTSKTSQDHKPIEIFPIGDDVLMRRETKCGNGLTFNEVVVIERVTEKAILFKISEEWKTECHYKGREFWEPKSILYMKEGEKKVYYLPHWATILLLNIDIPI